MREHAIYRLTYLFLSNQGADVNGGDHEHGYTPLHFSALAGMILDDASRCFLKYVRYDFIMF